MSQSITVAAYPERGAGNNPEPMGLVFLQGHPFPAVYPIKLHLMQQVTSDPDWSQHLKYQLVFVGREKQW